MIMKQVQPKSLLSLEELQAKLPHELKNIQVRRSELLTSLRTLTSDLGCGSDSADEADLKSEHESIQRELNRLAAEESNVQDAIRASRDECYGYCDCCGVNIPLSRMNSSPFTTQCVDCKGVLEVRAAQQTGYRMPSGARI
ncbi:hypothetical protein CRN52_12950 [Vibrio vulnificus]|uniref:Zinc finger DksA/TraR C4-type domain-containing protein n=3 Tax=Vibrio TaxID=662 RepID=A0A2S3R1J2_VIBVL|nr:hypothetical protein CRN52_12950 [Vibrio vulnificus]